MPAVFDTFPPQAVSGSGVTFACLARSVLQAVAGSSRDALTMIVSNSSSTMNTSAPASYSQDHPDGMTACQPVVSAADPEQLPTVDGLGVELGAAVTVRVDVGVGTAVQT